MHASFTTDLTRAVPAALMLTGLLALAACNTAAPETPEQQQQRRYQRFVDDFRQVLEPGVRSADLDGWSGGVSLRAVIDPLNRMVACSTEALPEYPLPRYPDNRPLAAAVERICWDSVFPRAEPELFSGQPAANLEVVLPVVVTRPGRLPAEEQKIRETVREYKAQEQYFWRQLFAAETLDSLGSARIEGHANAQGQVQACQVRLSAIAARASDFKPDPERVQRLQERCAALDIRQMPGFFASETVGDRFLVELQYSPWRGGPKRP